MAETVQGRVLALDYGERRIGTAVSDPLGITAQHLPALVIRNEHDALDKINRLIIQYQPVSIVLGLPLDQHGDIGPAAERVRKFGTALEKQAGVPVSYYDERFTSKKAEKALHEMGMKTGKHKGKIDSLSAVFILQDFLEQSPTGAVTEQ